MLDSCFISQLAEKISELAWTFLIKYFESCSILLLPPNRIQNWTWNTSTLEKSLEVWYDLLSREQAAKRHIPTFHGNCLRRGRESNIRRELFWTTSNYKIKNRQHSYWSHMFKTIIQSQLIRPTYEALLRSFTSQQNNSVGMFANFSLETLLYLFLCWDYDYLLLTETMNRKGSFKNIREKVQTARFIQ